MTISQRLAEIERGLIQAEIVDQVEAHVTRLLAVCGELREAAVRVETKEESNGNTERYAVWEGSFLVFGVELKCCVLDDGQRIIEADSMNQLFAAMSRGGNDQGDYEAFCEWCHAGRG